MTHSEKIQITKDIKSVSEYINDLKHEMKHQKPQRNGQIYLFGEPITKKRLRDAETELSNLLKQKTWEKI